VFNTNTFSIRADRVQTPSEFQANQEFPMIDSYPGTFPLGGFGTGTIGLSPDGGFLDWHFFQGVHLRQSIPGCTMAFSIPQLKKSRVLGGKTTKTFKGWQKLSQKELKNLTFSANYPLSKLSYQEKNFSIEVSAFSPVIAHNYRETSLPVAIFPVKIKNKSNKKLDISFMLSFQNLIGYSFEKSADTKYSFKDLNVQRKNMRNNSATIQSIYMSGEKNSGLNGEFCLAGKVTEEAKLHLCTNYDPYEAQSIWSTFSETGTIKERLTMDAKNKCSAIVLKTTLNPNDEVEIPLTLSWDIYTPKDKHNKYYLKFFDKKGASSYDIAKDALYNYKKWQKEIQLWQKEILENSKKSAAYKKALFNELYYIASSSIWDSTSGLLAYLESFDFLFYDTLDVRYYGSFPLAYLWPEIEKKVMLYFGKTVNKEHKTLLLYNKAHHIEDLQAKKYQGEEIRKVKGALPHDLGSPFEGAWQKINGYTWQNPNRWKDLNSKFVLQTYRCYYLSGQKDLGFLQKNLAPMEQALQYLLDSFDSDRDFLPENEGFPDQTFDNWTMKGTSAYCGNLFLAALRTLAHIEQLLGMSEKARKYRQMLRLAKDSYIKKLWVEHKNIGYFRFDETSNVLMSAQMMGEWYLRLLALPPVLPEEMIKTTLQTIYKFNFKKTGVFKPLGIVNGVAADGSDIKGIPQTSAVWTGINYALASHLYSYNYKKQANKIIKTISKTTYEKGLFFRTPEGWDKDGAFVSSMYMRPGAIWSMEVLKNE